MAMLNSPSESSTKDFAWEGRGERSPYRQLLAVRSLTPYRRENSTSPKAAMYSDREDISLIPPIIPQAVDFNNTELHESLIEGIHDLAHYDVMDTKAESGARIKERRLAAKLKQREVCELVPGLTVTRLSNWEKGLRMISVDEAKRLAPAIKTTPGYLLTIDDESGDQRLQMLITTYRQLDERGRTALQRVAESQSEYVVQKSDEQPKAA